MLLIDEEAALAALPAMLPADAAARRKAIEIVEQILAATGAQSPEEAERRARIGRLFGVEGGAAEAVRQFPFRTTGQAELHPKAS